MKETLLATSIIETVGTAKNIQSVYNCMTRVRIKLINDSIINLNEIKQLPDVLGVINANGELQIVLGPGKAAKITQQINSLLKLQSPGEVKSPQESQQHDNISKKKLFNHLSRIFTPLIPAFVACGLLAGILTTINQINPCWGNSPVYKVLIILSQSVFSILDVLVGINTANEFNGTPVISGVLAAFISSPLLADIQLFNIKLLPGRGGIISVLLLSIFACYAEKRLRSILPNTINFFLNPFIVLILTASLGIVVFQPVCGLITDTLEKTVLTSTHDYGLLAGCIMGGIFLPLVMIGAHQILTPVHLQLISQTGQTLLLPILAMAGAGQIGAALAIYLKTKNPKLKQTIISALPVALMGIAEPLIYGVTLPLGKPFFTACIGGAIGGSVQAILLVGSKTIGLSGLLLIPVVNKPMSYLIGIIAAYAGGFITTLMLRNIDTTKD